MESHENECGMCVRHSRFAPKKNKQYLTYTYDPSTTTLGEPNNNNHTLIEVRLTDNNNRNANSVRCDPQLVGWAYGYYVQDFFMTIVSLGAGFALATLVSTDHCWGPLLVTQ